MRLRRDERGFVLITAMLVLGVFMALSLAMVTVVNVQADQTGHERSGEAAFNLADSVLQAEADQLQSVWPTTPALAPVCSSTTPQTGCGPGIQELQSPTLGSDYSGATWGAQAFEDFGTGYSASRGTPCPTTTTVPCPWDATPANSMWLRAWATANGQTRTVVERVKRRLVTASLPENVVTAGGFYTDYSNSNAQKATVTATDASGSGVLGAIDVRCGTAGMSPPQTDCLGWQPGQVTPQSPPEYTAGYVDPSGGSGTLSADQIQSLIQEAQADKTYYDISSPTQCPKAGTYPLVVVEGAVQCSYQGGDNWNTATPGVLVFLNGSVSFGGSSTFNGVLYMANQSNVGGLAPCVPNGSSPLVNLSGSSVITGAVFVDGCGTVYDNDSGDGLRFSANALSSVQTYATATPVPGTFRVVTQ